MNPVLSISSPGFQKSSPGFVKHESGFFSSPGPGFSRVRIFFESESGSESESGPGFEVCQNDSRYPQFWTKNEKKDPIFFLRFPAPKRSPKKRERWIKSCHRGDGFECKKDHYICSLHFVGESGPTKEYPDPLSAITSEENVRWFVIQISYLPYSFCGFKHIFKQFLNIQRLNVCSVKGNHRKCV